MKRIVPFTLCVFTLLLLLTSCGISKEVRTASISLVAKQKKSLEAHRSFHTITLATLNEILDAEQAKSDRDYKKTIQSYHQAMLDELKSIYENASLSEADKKVNEEKARQTILGYIEEAEANKKKRETAIAKAKNSLSKASAQLLQGEEAKSEAIEKMNAYLQAKRPSERLLEAIDLDLEKYSDYVTKANDAIKVAEPIIDKLTTN